MRGESELFSGWGDRSGGGGVKGAEEGRIAVNHGSSI